MTVLSFCYHALCVGDDNVLRYKNPVVCKRTICCEIRVNFVKFRRTAFLFTLEIRGSEKQRVAVKRQITRQTINKIRRVSNEMGA